MSEAQGENGRKTNFFGRAVDFFGLILVDLGIDTLLDWLVSTDFGPKGLVNLGNFAYFPNLS